MWPPSSEDSLLARTTIAIAFQRTIERSRRSSAVHPRELVEACLRRIEAIDPKLNAFRTTMADEALAAADDIPPGGLLAGVPIAVKADTPVAGEPTTRGSKTYGPAETSDAEV